MLVVRVCFYMEEDFNLFDVKFSVVNEIFFSFLASICYLIFLNYWNNNYGIVILKFC